MTMDLDFEADELVMLRQLFRDEAHDALEQVTRRILASGSAAPPPDALAEMMRVTHTIKGAAGTVGLTAMVELAHRLESAFAAVTRDPGGWTRAIADLVVEITDGMHGFVDQLVAGQPSDASLAALRAQIARIADVPPERPSQMMTAVPIPMPDELPERPRLLDDRDDRDPDDRRSRRPRRPHR